METTEFLVVDREDFEKLNLFEYHNHEYSERLTFFRDNPLLQGCDEEFINLLAGSCKGEWSIHNQVVVKDSNKTTYVYFVKSGRLSVVRLLQLDSCQSFKKELIETGAFPKLNKLSTTLRSTCSHSALNSERKIKRFLAPDINCSVYM